MEITDTDKYVRTADRIQRFSYDANSDDSHDVIVGGAGQFIRHEDGGFINVSSTCPRI